MPIPERKDELQSQKIWKSILLTGVIDIETVMSAINKAGAFRFIPKPWDDDQLLDNIREGLKFRDILLENRILAETVREQRKTLRSLGYED